ncbi:MAG: MFS transporter [Alphaproteobacteria bacterium]|nr:MFS transporter [Alphaproteobacteria bacterium]
MSEPEPAARADGAPARLSRPDLALYGLPGLPLAAATLPVYIHIPTFYAVELGLGLALVGFLMLLARLWDVVSDPIIGFLSDATTGKLGSWGRRKPWVLLGTPVAAGSFYALLAPPEDAAGLYLIVATLTLYTGWTMVNLPYAAWGAELSPDYEERTRIAGWREGLVIVGTVFAAAAPTTLSQILSDGDAPSAATLGPGLAAMGLILAIALPVCVLPALLCLPDPPTRPKRRRETWRDLYRALSSNAPFRRLLLAWLFNGVANGLPASLFLLFVSQKLGLAEMAGPLLLIYFAAAIVGLPLWLRLGRTRSKHRLWCGAMLWACLWFAIAPFLGQGDFTLFLIVCIATGAALGADLALPSSMQADVVDEETAVSGEARTGAFFALWGMAQKLSLALAVGIAFPVLEWVGFDPQAAQTGAAGVGGAAAEAGTTGLWALSGFYAVAPILFKLIAVSIMWSHPLDRARQTDLRRTISQKNNG